jgi:hypothetical protein
MDDRVRQRQPLLPVPVARPEDRYSHLRRCCVQARAQLPADMLILRSDQHIRLSGGHHPSGIRLARIAESRRLPI